jgi:hypothetical protein
MYGQSQCHYHDQEDGGRNNYRLAHGVIVADTLPQLRQLGYVRRDPPRQLRPGAWLTRHF